jgi:hypothetical protein
MSRRNPTPMIHSEVPGLYHGDGLYPEKLTKPPQLLLRSCRTSTGWCKRRLDTSEVLSLYAISDTVALDLIPKLRYKVIGIKGLTPVKILSSAALAVIKEVPGGGAVKLLPLPQPPVRARTDARTNPSAQRATQLRSVLARVYAVSIQNQITTTVP